MTKKIIDKILENPRLCQQLVRKLADYYEKGPVIVSVKDGDKTYLVKAMLLNSIQIGGGDE